MAPPSEKRIELLQNAITRMAQNSFTIKGWGITVVSALLALSADKADRSFAAVALLPTLLFWGLDGYYLMKEKHFRELSLRPDIPEGAQFDLTPRAGTATEYFGFVFSRTVWPIYGTSLGVSVLVALTALRQ